MNNRGKNTWVTWVKINKNLWSALLRLPIVTLAESDKT